MSICKKIQFGITIVICLSLIHCSPLLGQHHLDPVFTKFKGAVYQLPFDSLPLGYRPYVEYLVPAKHIVWDEILVRESISTTPFPEVKYKVLFGIIFRSTITILEDGKYEFILASDDGSKLWIDDRLVVDNDKPHPMRIERDTLSLRQGSYPIKLWYYQAYPNKYGIMFSSNYIGAPTFVTNEPIVWNSDILFDFDKADLSVRGIQLLDSLVSINEVRHLNEIRILGHTDNTGDKNYNYNLSQLRSQSIKNYLAQTNLLNEVNLVAEGYGEDKPRVPNTTAINRAKNRRVELIMN